ncbi:MAG: Tetratricopeptide TPR_2 repeat protein [Parcubacteria group bacterium GW2011_GWA2_47_8]|nr:MAG: Tetratricopeptide TPR_2 repeat protein [Parcubacteria group bacterium GW2011_GWA2_47_8]
MLLLLTKIVLGVSFLGIVTVGGRVLWRLWKNRNPQQGANEQLQGSLQRIIQSLKIQQAWPKTKEAVMKRADRIHAGIMSALETLKGKIEQRQKQWQATRSERAALRKAEQETREKSQLSPQQRSELIAPQVAHEKRSYFTSLLSSMGKDDGGETESVVVNVKSEKELVEPETIAEKPIEAPRPRLRSPFQSKKTLRDQMVKIRVSAIGDVDGGSDDMDAPAMKSGYAESSAISSSEQERRHAGIIARRNERQFPLQTREEVENADRTLALLKREERALLEAIMRTPRDIRLYKRLGVVYQELGAEQDAQRCFKEALRRGSQDPEVRKALAHVHVAG